MDMLLPGRERLGDQDGQQRGAGAGGLSVRGGGEGDEQQQVPPAVGDGAGQPRVALLPGAVLGRGTVQAARVGAAERAVCRPIKINIK